MLKHQVKVFPGSFLPANATHHVCSSQPMPCGADFKGTCAVCGGPVFFQDKVPDKLIKICTGCYLKLIASDPKTTSVANVDSITKFILAGQRN